MSAPSPSPSAPAPKLLPALTGMRALAAVMVYLHHFPMPIDDWPGGGLALDLAKEFHVGVTAFFVLSGFVITWRYSDVARFERAWLWTYFRDRFARIYPLVLLVTAVTFWVRPSNSTLELVVNFTLTKGFFNDYKFTGVDPAWTLSVEECFYASAPLIFFFAKQGRLWVPFVVTPLVGYGLLQVVPPFHGLLRPFPFVALYTYFGRFLEFFVGIGLALFFKANQLDFEKPRRRFPALTLVGGVATLLTIVAMALTPSTPEVSAAVLHEGGYGVLSPAGIVLNNLVLPVPVGVLYAGLLLEDSRFRRGLSTWPMVLLGQASYAFYLIHMGVIQKLVVEHVSSDYVVVLAVLLVLSVALFKLVEDPMNRLLRGTAWAGPR